MCFDFQPNEPMSSDSRFFYQKPKSAKKSDQKSTPTAKAVACLDSRILIFRISGSTCGLHETHPRRIQHNWKEGRTLFKQFNSLNKNRRKYF